LGSMYYIYNVVIYIILLTFFFFRLYEQGGGVRGGTPYGRGYGSNYSLLNIYTCSIYITVRDAYEWDTFLMRVIKKDRQPEGHRSLSVCLLIL